MVLMQLHQGCIHTSEPICYNCSRGGTALFLKTSYELPHILVEILLQVLKTTL